MFASLFPIRRSNGHVPDGHAPGTGAPRRAAVLLTIVAATSLIAPLPSARTLPACDAPDVRERLADGLEGIPALAGRQARLLGLEGPRVRGHAGRHPLRACQGRLVTSAGSGAIEYSIRRTRDGALAVRTELFQGGWRTTLDPRTRAVERVSSRSASITRAPDGARPAWTRDDTPAGTPRRPTPSIPRT